MTLEEYVSEMPRETGAPTDVGEFIDALRSDGYRVVKLAVVSADLHEMFYVTEELT